MLEVLTIMLCPGHSADTGDHLLWSGNKLSRKVSGVGGQATGVCLLSVHHLATLTLCEYYFVRIPLCALKRRQIKDTICK